MDTKRIFTAISIGEFHIGFTRNESVNGFWVGPFSLIYVKSDVVLDMLKKLPFFSYDYARPTGLYIGPIHTVTF